MPKRPIATLSLIAVFAALAVATVSAGDGASFVDLGFSADGRSYMFAQYGVESASLKPWAELYVVDVPKNDFAPGGVKKAVYDDPTLSGQDGSGAFHKLLADNSALVQKHKIDNLRQGTPLFIALDAETASGAPIEFRDFDAGESYKATLVPYLEGAGTALKSSFYINLERTGKDGKTKKYAVGTPSVKRPRVLSYTIRRAVKAPRDGSLIFVVEMKVAGAKGADVRYMVEAVRL